MLNLLTKTTPWMVASLLVAASGFGQDNRCCPQPKPRPQCCEPVKCEKVCPPVCAVTLIPAYNQSAAIDTRCSWDVWVDGSFTYWQALQDNMELGIADNETAAQITAGSFAAGHVINTDFGFKPGFKVGLGMKFDYDDWDGYADYTWFRSSVNTSSNGPATDGTALGLIAPMQGSPALVGGALYNSLGSNWTCNMDLIDAVMGRCYYVGTKLTFHPYAGARAAWIRQWFNTTYTLTDAALATAVGGGAAVGDSETNNQNSHSWALGPKMGLDINWMLGEGFRLYSCGSADVLFTRYNSARLSETTVGGGVAVTNSVSQKHINTIRTHIDMEMGLGWGTYLDCNNWYLDLSAGYGFQAFFNQNMFRNFSDDTMRGKSFDANGNLYIQGMTATVTLHF